MAEFELWTAGRAAKAIFATAAALVLIGVAIWLANWSDNYRSTELTQEKAFARMRGLAGPDALDCGQVAGGMDASPALRCLERAMREGRPFWIARENSFHPRVAMEPHWMGYTRNRAGRQSLVIFYEPVSVDATGSLQVRGCPRIQLRLDDGLPGPTCIEYVDGKRYQLPPFWFKWRTRPAE
ncbi:hypothetical protein [Arenimonas sp.]|uniref:hypothetical protein n=1 Tax=Arenimonas sp. TaxID=1872635 RepID=UPI0039E397FB